MFAAAPALIMYNRKNYQWDGKLRIKREFQEQDLRLRQFSQYREDVRDLMELTYGKMDIILILDCVLLELAVLCLVKGHYESLDWLLWLEFMSLTSGFLLLLISAYLAMHCSVVAHSFATRLLTQFVRLPIVSSSQLDNARAYAEDFEKGDSLLRVPFLAHQARSMLNQYVDIFDEGQVDVATLDHVKLFRRLQNNFMAYDAYARAGTALGANQILYGLFYKILGLSFLENHSLVLALGSVVAIVMSAIQIKKTDLDIDRKVNRMTNIALLAPLAVASTIMAFRHHKASVMFLPIVFFLHAFWVLMLMLLLKPDNSEVALPSKFRQVLYLDVFGARNRNILFSAPAAAWEQGRRHLFSEAGTMRAPPSPARNKPRGASVDTLGEMENLMSPRGSMAGSEVGEKPTCYAFADDLQKIEEEVLAYLSNNVEQKLPDFFGEAEKLMVNLSQWKQDNALSDGYTNSFFEMDISDGTNRRVSKTAPIPEIDRWLCLPIDPSVHYFHCSTGEYHEHLPRGVKIARSLEDLNKDFEKVKNMWSTIAEGSFPQQESEYIEDVESNERVERSEMMRRLRSSVGDERAGLHGQANQYGDGMRNWHDATSAVDHAVGIGAAFHPEQVQTTREGHTIPGQIPWRLFLHASLTLLFLWGVGFMWSFLHFVLKFHVTYPFSMFSDKSRVPWAVPELNLPIQEMRRVDVRIGVVSEYGSIVADGDWRIAAANDEWKVLATKSQLHIGTSWAEAAHSAPVASRNASRLAVGENKLWALTAPSLVTVYDVPSLQPIWDFKLLYRVQDIFSLGGELGVIRSFKDGGCGAKIIDREGEDKEGFFSHVPESACVL